MKLKVGKQVDLLVVVQVGVEVLSFGPIELTLVQNIKGALVGHRMSLLSIYNFMKFSYEAIYAENLEKYNKIIVLKISLILF